MPMAILRMLATTLLVSSTTTASCQTTCSLQRESVQKAFFAPSGIPFNIFTTFFLKASCLQKDYFQLSTHISTKLPTAQQRKSELLQKFRASVTIFSWEIDLCGIFLRRFMRLNLRICAKSVPLDLQDESMREVQNLCTAGMLREF